MRRMAMILALVALAVSPAGAQQQQEDQQAERRRALEQQMRQLDQQMRALERQMRDLERQLERLGPEARRTEVRVPMVQLFTRRAYLGVTVATEKDPAADSIGARLAAVSPGGPADKAGLKAGDIITTFNGEKLAGRYPAASEYESEPGRKLVDLARELEEGDTVVVDYRRGQETHRATIVARRLEPGAWGFVVTTPPVPPIPPIHVQPERLVDSIMGAIGWGWPERWLDLELVKLDPELGEYFGTSEGLLVVRAPKDSTLKLKSGDVILSVDGRRPSSQSQLMRILRSYAPGEAFKLEIVRQKRRLTLLVTVPERRFRRGGLDPLDLDLEWRPLASLPG